MCQGKGERETREKVVEMEEEEEGGLDRPVHHINRASSSVGRHRRPSPRLCVCADGRENRTFLPTGQPFSSSPASIEEEKPSGEADDDWLPTQCATSPYFSAPKACRPARDLHNSLHVYTNAGVRMMGFRTRGLGAPTGGLEPSVDCGALLLRDAWRCGRWARSSSLSPSKQASKQAMSSGQQSQAGLGYVRLRAKLEGQPTHTCSNVSEVDRRKWKKSGEVEEDKM